MTWYPLETADAGIFDSAPLIYRFPMRVAVPPARVWESLVSDNSVADWGPGAKSVTWLTPRPFGVGTEREVVLAAGVARVRERFFRWDESPGILGYSFYAYEASFPMMARFAENYVLEPDGDGTLFTWTIAIEPKPKFAAVMKALSFVNRVAFGRTAADAKKYFAARAG
ncbi:SRPBCC family protein [Jatrophihabitans endophyticus]|uniref:SRPBCC family protein n=1 Tax=Jatrophihabitans endophyticus TaxID=1206085 RepID=UPI0019EE3C60|nr:SRPBCC family protein [Jatrophihabitans endophyticus]MBE7190181.1 SRPBCC family protein [Jatrophihabitans endophyticus]